jgi:hypothetical protein
VSLLRQKPDDEIVARLSELAEGKIGRLTFHFAAVKLGKLETEVKAFSAFIARERFQLKRNLRLLVRPARRGCYASAPIES